MSRSYFPSLQNPAVLRMDSVTAPLFANFHSPNSLLLGFSNSVLSGDVRVNKRALKRAAAGLPRGWLEMDRGHHGIGLR